MKQKIVFSICLWAVCAAGLRAQVSETRYDYSDAARQMTAGCENKLQQAEAIYRWMCRNIAYDTDYQIRTADACWDQKRGVCQAYCELFYRLAQPLGLDCRIITGKSKTLQGTISPRGHAWLYVDVGDTGILVDPTWGAGSVVDGVFERSDEDMSWFRVSPYWLIFTHYPDDKRDQFLDEPIDQDTFASLPYLVPALGLYGLNGGEIFWKWRTGALTSLPRVYEHYGDEIDLLELPLQRTLRPGEFYTFTVRKKGERDITLVQSGEYTEREEWDMQAGGVQTIRYMPKGAGQLKLVVGDKRTYYTVVEYQIPRPTAEEWKNIERHYPYAMPEMDWVANVQPAALNRIGIDGHRVLEAVRKKHLKSLFTLYSDADAYVTKVDVPFSQTLKVGERYTFTVWPRRGLSWAVINKPDWYQDWTVDEENRCISITVTPQQAGELRLSVQREEGGAFYSVIGYTVEE